MKPTVLVISCEHAVNTVPDRFQAVFQEHQSVLTTARAVDFGALEITEYLHQTLGCAYTHSNITHLLIDCNRSLMHQSCFSSYARHLSKLDKQYLIDHYYIPFRQQTCDHIQGHIDQGKQVLHLSIHTFPASRGNVVRNAGIGILYDSQRHGEKEVARLWHGLLMQQTPAYRIRMNYPYSGSNDNFACTLRSNYTEHDYLGLEVECNQALIQDQTSFHELKTVLSHSLAELLQLL